MLKLLKSKIQLARDDIRRWIGLKLFDHPKQESPIQKPIKHILVIRWDAKWGDSFVSSFFFREARKAYPDIRFTVIAPANMADYCSEHLEIDQVLILPKRPNYEQLRKTVKQVGHVDLTIHLGERLKLKDLFFLNQLNTDHIAGLDDKAKCINIKLGADNKGKHYSELFEDLLVRIDVKNPDTGYHIPRIPDCRQKLSEFISNIPKPYLVINPYGSGSSRQLSSESISTLVKIVKKLRPQLSLCLLLTPEKKEDITSICNQHEQAYAFIDTESIFDSIEIIANANWVFSVDTAVIHIASGLQKPTLGLYNPDQDNYDRWHPNNPKAISMFASSCSVPDINQINWQDFEENMNALFTTDAK